MKYSSLWGGKPKVGNDTLGRLTNQVAIGVRVGGGGKKKEGSIQKKKSGDGSEFSETTLTSPK